MFMFQDATKLQRAELQHHNTESTDKQLNGPNNDSVIQFPTVRFLCLRLRVFQRCLSLSHESEMSRKQGPPTHLQARTNRNDFSAGEHPLQLSSPRQCLREKAWETLFFFLKHATKGNKQPARSVRRQGAGLCDSLWKLGHICISERFSGTRGNRLSWSNRVAQHIWSTRCEVTVGVCTAYLRVCPSIWLKLQPVASKECRRTEKSPQSVNVLCL